MPREGDIARAAILGQDSRAVFNWVYHMVRSTLDARRACPRRRSGAGITGEVIPAKPGIQDFAHATANRSGWTV